MMDFIQTLYQYLGKPPVFASWARPLPSELYAHRQKNLLEDGTVQWDAAAESGACADHLELSGFESSSILSYGRTSGGKLRLMKHLIVPGLRTLPDVTQSSYGFNFHKPAVIISMAGEHSPEYLEKAFIRGKLELHTRLGQSLYLIRQFYPSPNYPALLEKVTVTNQGNEPVRFLLENSGEQGVLPPTLAKDGPFLSVSGGADESGQFDSQQKKRQWITLGPGRRHVHYGVYYSIRQGEKLAFSVPEEIRLRQDFIESMFSSLIVETPFREINAQFSHSVLRGSESIFRTKQGLMHSPGGGNYYAALWTNDQCEYANPFFPFSGYQPGIEQAINGYRLYEKYMDSSDRPMEEKKPLVSSIICGGDSYWNGAGDRGDAAMTAYGLGRFLLEMGDETLLKERYSELKWCLDYCLSRKNKWGVVQSDSDELENRFESGTCNLFTSCLTYDALDSGAILAGQLHLQEQANQWRQERRTLKTSIEHYFGDTIEGYETYRYYAGNEELRAWICMPLTVEIFDRSQGTIEALFSKKLYQNATLRTSSRHRTTWDRSLLFAMRGTLLAGYAKKGMTILREYCQNRLLGSHSPYPFEAFPEGNRAQLAAESLLFARVLTEGLLGLKAVGWHQLRVAPSLSDDCPWVHCYGLHLFGRNFDIQADRECITLVEGDQKYVSSSNPAVFDFSAMQFLS